jgi:hypothetical protein
MKKTPLWLPLLVGQLSAQDVLPLNYISCHSVKFHEIKIRYLAVSDESFVHEEQGVAVAALWYAAYLFGGNCAERAAGHVYLQWRAWFGIFWLHLGLFGSTTMKPVT